MKVINFTAFAALLAAASTANAQTAIPIPSYPQCLFSCAETAENADSGFKPPLPTKPVTITIPGLGTVTENLSAGAAVYLNQCIGQCVLKEASTAF